MKYWGFGFLTGTVVSSFLTPNSVKDWSSRRRARSKGSTSLRININATLGETFLDLLPLRFAESGEWVLLGGSFP
jgi:hypothetical protein